MSNLPDNPKIQINTLRPFTRFCCTIGEIPTSYLASLTYQEQLLWLCDYLKNTIIPTVNTNAEAVTELQNLYEELRTYVDNYFTDLNVQDQINNKLDAMASDGTLDTIINQNIFNELNTDINNLDTKLDNETENINNSISTLKNEIIFTFDTLLDLQVSPELKENYYAHTLGYYALNDGGHGIYKIREKTENDTINNGNIVSLNNENLIAELIVDKVVNVKQFGAYGDGVHDDSSAIQKAINFANNNYVIYFDKSTYLILNTITLNIANQIFKCDGTLKTTNNNTILSSSQPNQTIEFDTMLGYEKSGVGLQLTGYNFSSTFKFNKIEGFEKGIALSTLQPNHNGIQYCDFTFSYMNNLYDIYAQSNNDGWINENYFHGGQLSGNNAIYFKAPTSENSQNYNGNIFYNFGFEGNVTPLHLENCTMNTFTDFRVIESASSPIWFELINSSRNLFESNTTSGMTFNRINDNYSSGYQNSNIYKIRTGNNSSYSTTSSYYLINNGLALFKEYNMASLSAYASPATETTISTAQSYNFDLITEWRFDVNKDITINLDERYDLPNSLYDNIIISIGARATNSNVIVNNSAGQPIFNLNNQTTQTGTGINKTYLIKKLPRNTQRYIQELDVFQ